MMTIKALSSLNRRDSIQLVLESILSTDQLHEVMTHYDATLASVDDLLFSDFCANIQTTLPEVPLTHEARLVLLRAVRRPIEVVPTTSADQPAELPSGADAPLERMPRKTTHLEGAYWLDDGTNDGLGTMDSFIVANLSQGGAGLTLFRPNPHLTAGTVITLHFTLDNASSDEVEISAQVRWVKQESVGVQFLSADRLSQALLAYLQTESN